MSNLDVPDYNLWVGEEEEMWMEEIMRRVRKGDYKTHEPMLAHIEQIHANAVKYNTPGNGQFGGPGRLSAHVMALDFHTKVKMSEKRRHRPGICVSYTGRTQRPVIFVSTVYDSKQPELILHALH